jgi:hypothetical protein
MRWTNRPTFQQAISFGGRPLDRHGANPTLYRQVAPERGGAHRHSAQQHGLYGAGSEGTARTGGGVDWAGRRASHPEGSGRTGGGEAAG